MRPTVEQQLRTRGVQGNEIVHWINREASPFLAQSRQAQNQTYRARFSTTTAGTGVATAIWASSPDIAVGKVWLIEATVMARATGARSAWIIRAVFYNDGTVTQEGVTDVVYTQSAAAFSPAFLIDGNHIGVTVTDDGALTVDWQCWIELRETPA